MTEEINPSALVREAREYVNDQWNGGTSKAEKLIRDLAAEVERLTLDRDGWIEDRDRWLARFVQLQNERDQMQKRAEAGDRCYELLRALVHEIETAESMDCFISYEEAEKALAAHEEAKK